MNEGKHVPDGDLTDDPTLNLDLGRKSQLGAVDSKYIVMSNVVYWYSD